MDDSGPAERTEPHDKGDAVTAADRVFDAVRGVVCGQAVTFQNLTLLPLVAGCDRDADYVVLDEALARGWVEVTELSEEGHVPELKSSIAAIRPFCSSMARNWWARNRTGC
jgi:hypothetical protein